MRNGKPPLSCGKLHASGLYLLHYEWKKVNLKCISDPRASFIYMRMHLCVCMRMRTSVFEGVCLYLSVTVYTLSA